MSDNENSPPRTEVKLNEFLLATPMKPKMPPRRMTFAMERPSPSVTASPGWNDPPPTSRSVGHKPYKLTQRVNFNLSMPLELSGPTLPGPLDGNLVIAKNNIQAVIDTLPSREVLVKTMKSFEEHWSSSSLSTRNYVLDVSILIKNGDYKAAKESNDQHASSAVFFSLLFKHILSSLEF